jgi:Na+-driven multidrug efflux pump
VAFTLNGQGITILLSVFGTAVNAARGIAGSVSGVVYRFVDSFQAAAKPQIVKLCAVHDYDGMNNLIMRVSKFSSYLMGFIGIPLFLEMDYVLQLWLKDVPEFTTVFARLTLIQGLVQSMDFPIGAGIHAVGKMKLPNLTSAFIYMVILPVSYIGIKLGASPQITYVMVVCMYPLAMFMDLYILRKYTEFRTWEFLRHVVIKSIILILMTAVLTEYIVAICFLEGFLKLMVTCGVSSVIFLLVVSVFGLTHRERNFIKGVVIEKLHLTYE